MTPINTLKIDLSNAKMLSSKNTETQLFRFDLDSYAVISDSKKVPSFAFKSFEFSALIDTTYDDIVDVIVVTTICESRQGKPQSFEIRLLLTNADQIVINSDGEMSRISPLIRVDIDNDDRVIKPVREIWNDLPEEHEKIVFTQNLIKRLSPDIERHGAKNIISRMWSDYEATNQPLVIEEVVLVQGEWAEYAITELRSGRAVFMTLDEVKPDDFEFADDVL